MNCDPQKWYGAASPFLKSLTFHWVVYKLLQNISVEITAAMYYCVHIVNKTREEITKL